MISFQRAALWLLVGMATVVLVPLARPCSPDMESLAFTWETHPDFPLNTYAQGSLGIIQPTYARSYLVVAYRYLTNKPLKAQEQKEVCAYWAHRLGGGAKAEPFPSRVDRFPNSEHAFDSFRSGLPDWTSVRASHTQSPGAPPTTLLFRDNHYTPHVSEIALGLAAATLKDRSSRWSREDIEAWIQAQDRVFAATGPDSPIPPPTPSHPNPAFRRDRAYQIACAKANAGAYDAARSDFSAIAADAKSPWQRVALVQLGRCWMNEAERWNEQAPQRSMAAYRSALSTYQSLQTQGWPTQTRNLPDPMPEPVLDFVVQFNLERAQAQVEPAPLAERMVQKLVEPGGTSHFGDMLWRYLNLLDAHIKGERTLDPDPSQPRTIPEPFCNSDLTDWVFHFRETGPKAFSVAHARWKQRSSLPWLLMALANAEPHSPHVNELLAAAQKVPESQPGEETLAFHRARLLAASGQWDTADRIINQRLKASSPSSGNLWRALRLPHAVTPEAFLDDALRTPIGLYGFGDGMGDHLQAGNLGRQAGHPSVQAFLKTLAPPHRFLAGDGALVLNLRTPTASLLNLARLPQTPSQLKREWIRAAWVRAVLLEDWRLASDTTADLISMEPSLAASLAGFTQAPIQEQERLAWLTLVRNPGLRWMVFQGVNHRTYTYPNEKPLPLHHRDTYLGACWWPAMPEPGTLPRAKWYGTSFYYPEPHAMDPSLFRLNGILRVSTPWLSPEQQAQGQEEGRRLMALPAAPDWLATKILGWAQATPTDPRIPEALHHAVRAGKVGGTGKAAAACFRWLHKNHPQSPWTRKTPIHY